MAAPFFSPSQISEMGSFLRGIGPALKVAIEDVAEEEADRQIPRFGAKTTVPPIPALTPRKRINRAIPRPRRTVTDVVGHGRSPRAGIRPEDLNRMYPISAPVASPSPPPTDRTDHGTGITSMAPVMVDRRAEALARAQALAPKAPSAGRGAYTEAAVPEAGVVPGMFKAADPINSRRETLLSMAGALLANSQAPFGVGMGRAIQAGQVTNQQIRAANAAAKRQAILDNLAARESEVGARKDLAQAWYYRNSPGMAAAASTYGKSPPGWMEHLPPKTREALGNIMVFGDAPESAQYRSGLASLEDDIEKGSLDNDPMALLLISRVPGLSEEIQKLAEERLGRVRGRHERRYRIERPAE